MTATRLKATRSDTIRQAVLAHLAATGATRYFVATAVRQRVPPSLVYRWLAGKGNIGTDAASEILAALGLSVRADDRADRPASKDLQK